MNRSDARGRKTFEGWTGEFRPVWRAEYDTVQDRDDRGKFTGPKMLGKARSAAEELFSGRATA
jgi:hypothetical protein